MEAQPCLGALSNTEMLKGKTKILRDSYQPRKKELRKTNKSFMKVHHTHCWMCGQVVLHMLWNLLSVTEKFMHPRIVLEWSVLGGCWDLTGHSVMLAFIWSHWALFCWAFPDWHHLKSYPSVTIDNVHEFRKNILIASRGNCHLV